MASMKEVAKRAGVGIATVSRVINNSGYVKKETREKIEKVIREIEYVPNEIARSMTRQQTQIIAFILPHSNHVFFSQLLYHVENALYEYGYKMMVCNSGSNKEKELDLIRMLKNNRVDGLILLTSNDIEDYLRPELPIVSFDRRFKNIPFVASDNFSGGKIAAEVLLKNNPKKLLYIGDDAQGPLSNIETEVTKRRLGFMQTLEKQNFTNYEIIEYPLADLFVPKDYIEKQLEANLDADGIFCISDMVAEVVIKKLSSIGINVPEDVKVIGYDGIKSYLNLGKIITSIEQPVQELSKCLVKTLVDKIHNRKTEDIVLPVNFIQGETA